MTTALSEALRSIEAVGAHQFDGTGLAQSVRPVVRRVARRRAARAVGAGGAGLGVVAGLLVGSGQLGLTSGSSDAAAEAGADADGGDESTGYFSGGADSPVAERCALCSVTDEVTLRVDAAVTFRLMSDAFEAEFGQRLCVEQGGGTAVDLCSLEAHPEMRAWVDAHAGDFGWVATVADEPWRLEFRPASP